MANAYRDKLLSIGLVARSSLTRPVVREGRRHPETGAGFKRTEDAGSIVTEHATRDDRVDATAKVETVHAHLGELQQRRERASRGNQEKL